MILAASSQAFTAIDITFGSDNDGYGGFGPSAESGTETWTNIAGSVNYSFGVVDVDEGHTASLLRQITLDRTVGSSYTVEGVVDLVDGYGDDNNRIGVLLFNTDATQTSDGGGGLWLRLNTDNSKDITIEPGINGTAIASQATGIGNGDDWIGQTLTYTADLSFIDVSGTDSIDISFTLSSSSLGEWSTNAVVDAADYTGDYFGFATKWRQRGDNGSNRNVPAEMDYQSFSVIPEPATLGTLAFMGVLVLLHCQRKRKMD